MLGLDPATARRAAMTFNWRSSARVHPFDDGEAAAWFIFAAAETATSD